ncbi:glycosyltransferase family 2 protein [Humibacter ginsenosidimutans]|uniref:Glycosyltransferase family 2 protein n=1 Tax=Humibacter ginsenosidimutans TaxID=2599293 RepID=A0A5B8M670_9MICO|nr:glycosyltransferase family 2 protein [Humibacter ginsenosidimutans]QDZ15000.1 glycosyltransferase family 2 protein [Humibacter ginsenosidimutans]
MHLPALTVVMPAYNEAQGLPEFVREVAEAVRPHTDRLRIVVVDDRSTDGTGDVLDALALELPELIVVRSPKNQGHGPTALAAYRAGLETHPDAVLHVDGDGQFVGDDFPRVIDALEHVQVVHGVRTGRDEPWFRRLLTGSVGLGVAVLARGRVPDVNTPLRLYRAGTLRRLLDACPSDALVPHVHFSIAEQRHHVTRAFVPVRSIPRRGDSSTGTMWGAAPAKPKLPPKRLLQFSARAAREVWRYDVLARPVPPARPADLTA